MVRTWGYISAGWFLAWFLSAVDAVAGTLRVHDAAGLRAALIKVQAGDTVILAPGEYGHGLGLRGLKGTVEKRIVIAGEPGKKRPVFRGGKEGLHLVACHYLTLRHLQVTGSSDNGVNADDAGRMDTPSVGLRFEDLWIEKIGPKGNRDGLKLSGLDSFSVVNCHFEGWGGSAIDMVGCRRGVIERCRFLGRQGFSQTSGIQAKGGSEQVTIRRCVFREAGQRALNLGGSTGEAFFRPQVRDFEARDLVAEGNVIIGSEAAVAYTSSVRCQVRFNTIVDSGKWVMRILQEKPIDRFQPCRQGVFASNLVIYGKQVRHVANIGPNTAPKSFRVQGNLWFSRDDGHRPSMSLAESDGIHQVNPQLTIVPGGLEAGANGGVVRVGSNDPRVKQVGAHAFTSNKNK